MGETLSLTKEIAPPIPPDLGAKKFVNEVKNWFGRNAPKTGIEKWWRRTLQTLMRKEPQKEIIDTLPEVPLADTSRIDAAIREKFPQASPQQREDLTTLYAAATQGFAIEEDKFGEAIERVLTQAGVEEEDIGNVKDILLAGGETVPVETPTAPPVPTGPEGPPLGGEKPPWRRWKKGGEEPPWKRRRRTKMIIGGVLIIGTLTLCCTPTWLASKGIGLAREGWHKGREGAAAFPIRIEHPLGTQIRIGDPDWAEILDLENRPEVDDWLGNRLEVTFQVSRDNMDDVIEGSVRPNVLQGELDLFRAQGPKEEGKDYDLIQIAIARGWTAALRDEVFEGKQFDASKFIKKLTGFKCSEDLIDNFWQEYRIFLKSRQIEIINEPSPEKESLQRQKALGTSYARSRGRRLSKARYRV